MSNVQSLEALLALANAAAAISDDMTEAVKGGGAGRLLPEGYCLATMVEYVEYGQQPQEFGGVAKDPALEYQLGFALHTPGFCNEDGTPYLFRPYSQAISRNEKANAYLTFKAMNWKGLATHFAQFLGQGFLLKFEQKQPTPAQAAAGGKVKSVINMKATLPPLDTLSRAPYPMPPLPAEMLKLFLWSNPQVETWASFYQEGKYDDGGSKNRVQEKMLSALDFHGSALQAMLIEKQVPFTIPAPKAAAPKPAAPAAPAGPSPAAPVAMPAAPVAAMPVTPPFENAVPTVPAAVATPAPALPVAASPAPVSAAPAPAPVQLPAAVPAPVAAAMPSLPAMPSMPAMPAMPVA